MRNCIMQISRYKHTICISAKVKKFFLFNTSDSPLDNPRVNNDGGFCGLFGANASYFVHSVEAESRAVDRWCVYYIKYWYCSSVHVQGKYFDESNNLPSKERERRREKNPVTFYQYGRWTGENSVENSTNNPRSASAKYFTIGKTQKRKKESSYFIHRFSKI